jgi:hypothetical protein
LDTAIAQPSSAPSLVMRAGELKLTPQDIAEIEGAAAAHADR